jgi:acyl carrier protein
MTQITAEEVRQFLLNKYADSIHGIGLHPAEIGDDFDFLVSGVIDSFGVLDMVGSIEDQFRIRLDMATLDAEQITILGPLSAYVAQHATPAERG